MRRGLRLTPWTWSSEPGTSVAATTNGAAEREVAGDLDLAERQALDGTHRDARRPDRDTRAGGRQHALGVVAGRAGLDDRRLAVRVEPCEEHGRLDLGAGDGKRVVDRPERCAGDRHRQVPVRRLELRTHPAERVGDPSHRAPRERLVAGQLERLAYLSGQDPGDQAHERACVRAVDRPPGPAEAAQALAEDAQRAGPVLVDLHAERPHRGDRRLGVGRAAEPRDARLAVADRADQHRAVRDRLVARHGDVPHELRDGLDQHRVDRGAHSSITGAAMTP